MNEYFQSLLVIIQESFVDRLDYTLAYLAVTLLLAFYGSKIVRKILRTLPLSKVNRFIFFIVIILFGMNILLVFLISIILAVANIYIKWAIIVGLIIWCFFRFDKFLHYGAKEK